MTLTTNRPVVPFDAAQIPAEMKAAKRWMLWTTKAKADGTFEKPPVKASNPRSYANPMDPQDWSTFEDAVRALEQHGQRHNLCGLTFVPGDGWIVGDYDGCVDPETKEITDPEVAEYVEALDTYAEYSPSGTGIRFVKRGELPGENVKTDFVELWGNPKGRGTMTGARLESAPATVAPAGEALKRLYERARASKGRKPEMAATESRRKPDQVSARPVTPSAGEVPDDDEVRRAAEMNNKTFLALWGGGGDDGDESSGDIKLANILAYYCGDGGAAQVERLMKASGRDREKFEERRKDTTYLGYTVAKAYRDRIEYFDWSQWSGSPNKQKATGEGHKRKSSAGEPEAGPAGDPACGPASLKQNETTSRTDVGLARRLAHHARGTLRYVKETREWLGWNGKVWSRDNGLQAQHVAKRMSDEMWREWVKLKRGLEKSPEEEHRKNMRRFVENAASARGMSAAVSLARSEPEIIVSAEELDRHPFLLNVKNGVLDLERLELLPHHPKYLITQMAGVAFDPAASCPRWKQFIAEVTAGDDAADIAAYLQRLAGLCLTGDVSDHIVNFLFGQGANGKSVFLATLYELLGTYAATAPAELLMTKGQRGREVELLYGGLVGRRLVTVTENELGTRLSEATVKQLCGGDRVLWRRLYADPVETTPTWKILASTNHKPTVRGSDKGIWRRLVPVPWRNSFTGANADPRLAWKLRGELSGILNWALFGLSEWRRLGGLAVPKCLQEEADQYRASCDILGQWMAERCVTSTTAVVLAGDLFRDYSEWCDDRGEHAGTATAFWFELDRLGFKGERPNSGTYRNKTIRRGIGLMQRSEP